MGCLLRLLLCGRYGLSGSRFDLSAFFARRFQPLLELSSCFGLGLDPFLRLKARRGFGFGQRLRFCSGFNSGLQFFLGPLQRFTDRSGLFFGLRSSGRDSLCRRRLDFSPVVGLTLEFLFQPDSRFGLPAGLLLRLKACRSLGLGFCLQFGDSLALNLGLPLRLGFGLSFGFQPFFQLSCSCSVGLDFSLSTLAGARNGFGCCGFDFAARVKLGLETLFKSGSCLGLLLGPLLGFKPGRSLSLGFGLCCGCRLRLFPGLPFNCGHRLDRGLKLLLQFVLCLSLGLCLPLSTGPGFGCGLKLPLQLRDNCGKRLDLLLSTGFGRLDRIAGLGLDSGSRLSLGSEFLFDPGSRLGFLLGALLSLQSSCPLRFGLRIRSGSRFALSLNVFLCLGPGFERGIELLLQFVPDPGL